MRMMIKMKAEEKIPYHGTKKIQCGIITSS